MVLGWSCRRARSIAVAALREVSPSFPSSSSILHQRLIDTAGEVSSLIKQRGIYTYACNWGNTSPKLRSLKVQQVTASSYEYHFLKLLRAFTSEGIRDESLEETSARKKWHVDRLCPTSLRIRRIKERHYDDIIEKEKKVKIVMKIKEVLVAQPKRSIALQDLGKERDKIGLSGKRRCSAFLRRFPGVFEVLEGEEGDELPRCRLTPKAEEIYEEEVRIRESMERSVVEKVRKLLMMSISKQLAIGKLAHLARDIGLPEDFRTGLLSRYPQYFQVVAEANKEEGPVLKLTEWDPLLAVTTAERRAQELSQQPSSEGEANNNPPKLEIHLPKQYRLSRKDKWVIYKFHELKAPSPYEDASELHPASAESEKRAVLVVHEILSLTLEKRLLVDHLTHFRKEYKFSNQVLSMVVRHPEHFYVSKKAQRDTVFLREAYDGIHLPGRRHEHVIREKHPLILVKEKFVALMAEKSSLHEPSEEILS